MFWYQIKNVVASHTAGNNPVKVWLSNLVLCIVYVVNRLRHIKALRSSKVHLRWDQILTFGTELWSVEIDLFPWVRLWLIRNHFSIENNWKNFKILRSLNCKMSRQIVAVLTVWSISETWKRKMAFGDHNQAINETASIQESSLNRKKIQSTKQHSSTS